MNTISLLLVVHNEADRIYGFIRHIAPHVDEIVMVDQDSTDETVELAKLACLQTTMLVLDDDCHGFSEASNELALAHCTQEWVLVLFPDETLTDKALDDVQQLVQRPELDGVAFLRDTYLDGRPLILGERTLRLVRRDKVWFAPIVHHDAECRTQRVKTLAYTGIEHRKSEVEQRADNLRYFHLAGSEGIL